MTKEIVYYTPKDLQGRTISDFDTSQLWHQVYGESVPWRAQERKKLKIRFLTQTLGKIRKEGKKTENETKKETFNKGPYEPSK